MSDQGDAHEIDQNITEEGKTQKLRNWLPEKSLRESAFTGNFFLVIVALIFTLLFLIIDANSEAKTYPWIISIGATLSSIFLGFCLNNWWTQWQTGDVKRVDAIRIDDQIEEEIQWISDNWQQIINSLNLYKEPSEEFLHATKYLLNAQLNSVQSRIQKMALEIDRLGYTSSTFLEEKQQRFVQIRAMVTSLIRTLPDDRKIDELERILDSMAGFSGSKMLPPAKPEQID